MCRASPASSRRSRCVVFPADDVKQSRNGVSPKDCALHEEKTTRQTVSSSSSCCSSSTDEGEPHQDLNFCPVTGRLSNVLDDYIIFPKVLGEGQYGCVRECIHLATGKPYACKSIEKCKIGRLDHLQNEVELLSSMSHNSVMKMVDCYEDVDYLHIVTEQYTGGELFDKIIDCTSESGCYSETKAAVIIKSLLEAVAYLHENEIVHRDIKPENILFASKDEKAVKLIDFGLSRRHRKGDARMSNPVGTSYYMSPELLQGKYDKACDVWSVGTIVYILLCGYPPFNGDTDPDIFEAIKEGNLRFPTKQWSGKSAEARDFVKSLLRRDPRKRFTANEALSHPWIKNLGKKQSKVQRNALRLLRIP
mmetsp:Transcript_16254/g.27743  ORF Transcript_16254/g.27743 Transcript_16254/m.27743 type:complete len:363 (-) Transcript_16254:54-1142(-)